MIQQPHSLEDLLGSNKPEGKNFTGDQQRLSYPEAAAREQSLIAEYGETTVKKTAEFLGKPIELSYFEVTPEQKAQVLTDLMTGLRGLAGFSLHRYKVGEFQIDARFFSSSGGFHKKNEMGEAKNLTCSDQEIANLAYIGHILATLVGTAEKSLPPNELGYYPDSAVSLSNLDARYISGLTHLHSFIENELSAALQPDLLEEIKDIFDLVADRIERQRPAIGGRKISAAALPYFKTPPGEYFES